MKITMVSQQACSSGQPIHVRGLAAQFAEMGHDVEVKAAAAPEADLLAGVGSLADRLARGWRADRPDVVHAHGWLGGLAAMAAARAVDIPVVVTFYGLAHHARRNGDAVAAERTRLERVIGRSAARVIAISEAEGADLIRLGVPRTSVSVVPSGVDVTTFSPQGPALPRGDVSRLAAVVRPGARCGVAPLIRALPRIPDTELVVAGGPPRDELDGCDEIHRLRIEAKEAGVGDRVTFLGGLANEDVPRLLRSADLTVSFPEAEPFGRVPVESMACGTPVVVNPVGGNLDTVLDDVTGIVVTTRDTADLARRIRLLLADRTRRDALSIAGVDRARSRYTWERIAKETLKAYGWEQASADDDVVDEAA